MNIFKNIESTKVSSQKVLPHRHYILNVVFYTPGFLFPDLNLTQVVFFKDLQFTSQILKSAVKEKDNTASRLNRDGNSRLANAQK